MSIQQISPKAFKASPSLDNSRWYKGILSSQLAGAKETGGTFDFSVAKMRQGTEPPPHVHDREDEFFYVLSGRMHAYAEGQMFEISAGESMFLPRGRPHAFLIQSDIIEMTTLITPGGFLGVVNKMNEPAGAVTLPPENGLTYANMDLTRTIESFEEHGVHILSQEEIRAQMPEFPTGLE
jgi:mannose-6-phosphate isomerase-like protein (cupin superfamily)